ncbi:MAG: hypothetical protein AAGM84_07260 [Pseudomonadota bacterium]
MTRTLIILALMACPAFADTPEGYFASGWPIALAEAACAGDEGCLTLLANCGPGADCPDTAALCARSDRSATTAPKTPCTLHTAPDGQITVQTPGLPLLTISEDPERFAGQKAGIDGYLGGTEACWYVNYEPVFCARVLRSADDLAPWAPQ